MESKGYFIAIICLVGGVIGGYLAGSMSFQNQSKSYELQLQSKEAQIQQLQLQVQTLQANITSLQNIIKDLKTPKATQVRIDSVTWQGSGIGQPHNYYTITARNTGGAVAMIQSVSIRSNKAGSQTTTYNPAVGSNSINAGSSVAFSDIPFVWSASTSYVIRVTTTTGFYYEMVATTPSS